MANTIDVFPTMYSLPKGSASTSTLLVSATHTDTLTGVPVKGDIIYANATPKWTKLAGGTGGQALVMRAATSLPQWSTLSIAQTTGSLSVARGGTGITTPVKGGIIYSDINGQWNQLPIGSTDAELTVISGLPAWGTHREKYYITTVSSPTTSNSLVSAPVTGLSFAYVSAGKYLIDGCFLIKTSVATCGIKFKLGSSSAVTAIAMNFNHQLATAAGTLTGGHCYADNTNVGYTSGMPSANTVIPCNVQGILIATSNAAGTVTVRVLPEIAGKVTVLPGSILRVVKAG